MRGGRDAGQGTGDAEPTLVLVPSNPIVHSRQWKAQVPFLARHYRVVTPTKHRECLYTV